MVALPDLRGVDLTPEEGYLLSRIDGRINVGSLLSLVSWEREKTMSLLESLLRKHVVNFDRREIHDRAFGNGPAGPKAAEPSASAKEAAAAAPDAPIALDSLEKVPDLELERCAEIVRWEEVVQAAVTPYQVFSLPEGADLRSVKRRYREMAMSFHPDKFFRKEIGGYRARIEGAWKRVQEAYDILQDPEKRAQWEQAAREGRPAGGATPPPPAEAPKPAPGAPPKEEVGPAKAPGGFVQPMVIAPLDDFESTGTPGDDDEMPIVQGQRVDPRPQMESSLARRLKKDVQDRLEKARRFFLQAQQDLIEGKHALADSNLKLAMQFDPKNEEYRSWYERVRPKLEEGVVSNLLRKAEMAQVSSDVKTERECYEHALALFPDSIPANRAMGVLLAQLEEDPKRAKACLEKAVAKRPDDLTALVALAKSLRLLGMVKNAHRILDQAKVIDPKDPRVVTEAKELRKVS